MSFNPQELKRALVGQKIVTATVWDELVDEAKKAKREVEDLLVDKRILDEEKLAQIAAKFFDVEYADLKRQEIPKQILQLIPEPIARRHKVLAFGKDGKKLLVGMTDPDDIQTRDAIKKKTDMEVIPFMISKGALEYGLKQYHGSLEAEFAKIMSKQEKVEADTDSASVADRLKEMAEEIPVVRVVDTLLEYAIFEKASDIHIEPEEKQVMVRYRIDGVLHEVMTLPKVIQPALVARIKVISNLKIDEHRLPQDGRFKVQKDAYNISFRVSTIPVFDGEKVVMRLLDESAKALTLEELGFIHRNLEYINRNIHKPHGALLVTGPTGSGKSTTLYSVLALLNTKSVNISTIEDPIEYHMEGVNQMQVNPKIGLTFAMGLRALLRQDPNIIMIGEIRDSETAEEAVHAALTGHVVLSTIHTNNAAGALPRLLDIGVEAYLIASTVNAVVGQRLTRRICPDCKEEYKIDKEFEENLRKEYNIDHLLKVLKEEKLTENKVKSLTEVTFYRGKGCNKCADTGYRGRRGIYEVMEVSNSIQELIMKQAPTNQIQDKAIEEGMVLMWQDGFIKCLQGVTTIEEVMRVSRE